MSARTPLVFALAGLTVLASGVVLATNAQAATAITVSAGTAPARSRPCRRP